MFNKIRGGYIGGKGGVGGDGLQRNQFNQRPQNDNPNVFHQNSHPNKSQNKKEYPQMSYQQKQFLEQQQTYMGHSNNKAYDGKRMRKISVVRNYVDYTNSILMSYQKSKFKFSKKFSHKIVPHHFSYYWKTLDTPKYNTNNPSTCVNTKFGHASINKNRCPINVITWTPEGRRLITGASTGEFTLWNGFAFNFETIQQAHDGPIRSMRWSYNNIFMLSSDNVGYIKYWQNNMNNLKSFKGHSECIRDICFSPNDSIFISCSDDSTLKLWNFKQCKTISTLEGHGTDVRCCDWHPKSSLIISGGKDGLTKIWDARSGKHINDLHGHTNTIVRVKWNQNGNWVLTCSRDRNVKIYDIRFMKEFQTFKGHPREITSIDWHPHIEKLFASGGYDGALFYWIVGQREPAAKILNAHDSAIWDLKWHPVGHVLATGSNDTTTKFWLRNKPGETGKDGEKDDKSNNNQRNKGDKSFVNQKMFFKRENVNV